MIRLSRILNLNFPSRLSQDEIDALPKIKFLIKTDPTSSILLVEKCPICLTEFSDQEIINKLHCTHLFHLPCISTWLRVSEYENYRSIDYLFI
jgi:Ring finger domain